MHILPGVGGFVDSCRHCEPCNAGEEQYCSHMPTMTYNSPDRQDGSMTLGGYSDHIVVSDRFVLKMPAGLFKFSSSRTEHTENTEENNSISSPCAPCEPSCSRR